MPGRNVNELVKAAQHVAKLQAKRSRLATQIQQLDTDIVTAQTRVRDLTTANTATRDREPALT